MIVFGYKYPGWKEIEQATWKVQSAVDIKSGFNTLWAVISDLCQVFSLAPPVPLSLTLFTPLSGFSLGLVQGELRLEVQGRQDGGEGGEWVGYYSKAPSLWCGWRVAVSNWRSCFGQNKLVFRIAVSRSGKCPLFHFFLCFLCYQSYMTAHKILYAKLWPSGC